MRSFRSIFTGIKDSFGLFLAQRNLRLQWCEFSATVSFVRRNFWISLCPSVILVNLLRALVRVIRDTMQERTKLVSRYSDSEQYGIFWWNRKFFSLTQWGNSMNKISHCFPHGCPFPLFGLSANSLNFITPTSFGILYTKSFGEKL